jgi:hypothetical protein
VQAHLQGHRELTEVIQHALDWLQTVEEELIILLKPMVQILETQVVLGQAALVTEEARVQEELPLKQVKVR